MAFFSNLLGLGAQIVVFYFIGRLVDPSALPTYGGTQVTYLEFAAVGIGIAVFVEFGLQHVSRAIRSEQLMGTLDSLLMTPTNWSTIQLGSVAFELVFIPLRMTIFLIAIALAFGLEFQTSGIGPSLVLLLALIPFVWGLGIVAAAIVLTFRQGGGVVAILSLSLALTSGLYFPVDLLPSWLQEAAEHNPLAVATNGIREALVAGGDWSAVVSDLTLLIPMAAVSILVGSFCFRLALRREHRLGTIGLY
jgi:ABC-2 type transport system permease protein